MGNNYGYGPTKLRPAALYNEIGEKGIGGGGAVETPATVASLFSDWADANLSVPEKAEISNQFSTVFSTATNDEVFEIFEAVLRGAIGLFSAWANGFSIYPSSWAVSPPLAVTPHSLPGSLTASDMDDEYQEFKNWMSDLQIPGLGSIKIETEP